MRCIYGVFSDLQLVFSLKNFFNSIGCSNVLQSNVSDYNFDFRFLFLLNTSLASLEILDLVVLMFANLRLEVPLLASRLRKNSLANNSYLRIFSFGLAISHSSLFIHNLGNSIRSLFFFLEGKCRFLLDFFVDDFFCFIFLNFSFFIFEKPSFLIGTAAIQRLDSISLVSSVFNLSSRFFNSLEVSIFFFANIVSSDLGFLSACEIGGIFKKTLKKGFFFEYIINTDKVQSKNEGFFVYQGFFFNSSPIILKSNLILLVLFSLNRVLFI
jgi:hypothetical protein